MADDSRLVTLYLHLKTLAETARGAERATLNNVNAIIHRLMTMTEKAQASKK